MEWGFVVALVVAIPVILFPVAFVWYLNIGGVFHLAHGAREREERAKTKQIKETTN